MKKLMAVAIVLVWVLGALAGPALADLEPGIDHKSPNKVLYNDEGLHIPDKDGVANNPISIGGSGQN